MMLRQFRKLPAAVVLALMAAAATLIMAHAQEPTPAAPTQPEPQTPPCVACHTEFASEWKDGPHGQASTDPVFLNEWNSQGQPGACLCLPERERLRCPFIISGAFPSYLWQDD